MTQATHHRFTFVEYVTLAEDAAVKLEFLAYDRGEKLAHYQKIGALEEVVFVGYDRREVEVVRREIDGSWSRERARDGETVRLKSLDCELFVADVYRDPLATA